MGPLKKLTPLTPLTPLTTRQDDPKISAPIPPEPQSRHAPLSTPTTPIREIMSSLPSGISPELDKYRRMHGRGASNTSSTEFPELSVELLQAGGNKSLRRDSLAREFKNEYDAIVKHYEKLNSGLQEKLQERVEKIKGRVKEENATAISFIDTIYHECFIPIAQIKRQRNLFRAELEIASQNIGSSQNDGDRRIKPKKSIRSLASSMGSLGRASTKSGDNTSIRSIATIEEDKKLVDSTIDAMGKTAAEKFDAEIREPLDARANAIANYVKTSLMPDFDEKEHDVSKLLDDDLYHFMLTCMPKSVKDSFRELCVYTQKLEQNRTQLLEQQFEKIKDPMERRALENFRVLIKEGAEDQIAEILNSSDEKTIAQLLRQVEQQGEISAKAEKLLMLSFSTGREWSKEANDFISQQAPTAKELFDGLVLRMNEAKKNSDDIQEAFSSLPKEDQKKLEKFKGYLLKKHGVTTDTIKLSLQTAQIALKDVGEDLDKDVLPPIEKKIRSHADRALRSEYKEEDPEGADKDDPRRKVFDFVHQYAPEIADTFKDVYNKRVAIRGQLSSVENGTDIPQLSRIARGQDSSQSIDLKDEDIKEFRDALLAYCRQMNMDCKRLLGRKELSIKYIQEEIDNKLWPEHIQRISDFGKELLKKKFGKTTVPSGPVFEWVKTHARAAAMEMQENARHLQERTGPYMFTKPDENAEHAEMQQKLYDLYHGLYGVLRDEEGAKSDVAWREHALATPLGIDREPVSTPESLLALVENTAGGRSGRGPEQKLFLGAFESALAKVYLDQPVNELSYQDQPNYKVHLSEAMERCEKLPEAQKAEKMLQFHEKAKQVYEATRIKLGRFVEEYETERNKQPVEIKADIDRYHQEQIKRARKALSLPLV